MVIDFHTHIFPDALAERAVAGLASASGLVPVCPADREGMKAFLKANGVDRTVCQNIAVSPRTMRSVNDFAIASADEFVIPFGSVHPCGDYLPELEKLADHGIKGVKFHPEYQNFDIDDPNCFPVYEACFKLGLITLFHCGLDLAYSTPQRASAERVARFAGRFRGEKIVAAHLGGFSDFDRVEECLGGLGLYADLAACGMEYDMDTVPKVLSKEKLNAAVRLFGTDRVLFATDCPWQSPASGFRVMDLLDVDENQRQNILHGNAERLLGLV